MTPTSLILIRKNGLALGFFVGLMSDAPSRSNIKLVGPASYQ